VHSRIINDETCILLIPKSGKEGIRKGNDKNKKRKGNDKNKKKKDQKKTLYFALQHSCLSLPY
jgi:hypothetical protein